MSARTFFIPDDVYRYFQSVAFRESKLLKELRGEINKLASAGMEISPEQGQLLYLLIKLTGAKKLLEIGTFAGYSSIWMAQALPNDGHLIACDNNYKWTAIAKRFWQKAGLSNKITLHLAPALDTLKALIAKGESGSFDLAFIDADKNNYPHYYQQCLQLLRPGGLIAIDNVLGTNQWLTSCADESSPQAKTMRELNKTIYDDCRVELSMLPISQGLTLVRKR